MIFRRRERKTREGGPSDSERQLAERLGHQFSAPNLLRMALTHRSYANERGLAENYERLEFLGDAVLAVSCADWLYRSYPEATEGELSKLKSFLVSEPVLARLAAGLELGPLIRLGVGEERSGGRGKPSLLADVLEAVIAAVYLDGGIAPACRLIERLLAQAEQDRGSEHQSDAKSALQEHLQAQGRALPRYELLAADGPDHEKVFTVECRVAGKALGSGQGRSKKHAEQAAAAAVLEFFRSAGEEDEG